MNEYHPSTIRVQMTLQSFLAVDEKIDKIFVRDSEESSKLLRQVQIFIHSILYMTVMDKVIYGFVDSFMANQIFWITYKTLFLNVLKVIAKK